MVKNIPRILMLLLISGMLITPITPLKSRGSDNKSRAGVVSIGIWASDTRCQVAGGMGEEYDDIDIVAKVSDDQGNGISGKEVTFNKTWHSPELGPVDWGNFQGSNPVTTNGEGEAKIVFNGRDCPQPKWDCWRPNPVVITAVCEGCRANITIYLTWLETSDGYGHCQLRYFNSTVDRETMEYYEYRPKGFSPKELHPLMVFLHPIGEQYDTVMAWPGFREYSDKYGFVFVAPYGRDTEGLGTKHFWLDSPNPKSGPCERDILDMIDYIQEGYNIDEDRVYLSGYSMGGHGAFHIGFKNPDRFAAIAIGAGISDFIEMINYATAYNVDFQATENPEYFFSKGDEFDPSDPHDVSWQKMASPRFYLENVINVPVYVAHGDMDFLIPNNDDIYWPYMQAHHVIDTPGYYNQWGGPFLTIQDLHSQYGGSHFIEQHKWVPGAEHLAGAPFVFTGEEVVTFFNNFTRNRNPEIVVYKTYDDYHNRSYWARIDIRHPYGNIPGRIKAVHHHGTNDIEILVEQLSGVELNLSMMDLDFDEDINLSLKPVAYEDNYTTLELTGSWTENTIVYLEGVPYKHGDGWYIGGDKIYFDDLHMDRDHEITIRRVGDLTVEDVELTWNNPYNLEKPNDGDEIWVRAVIGNPYNKPVLDSFQIDMYVDDVRWCERTCTAVGAFSRSYVDMDSSILGGGNHTIKIVVDSPNGVVELNESNNALSKAIHVNILPRAMFVTSVPGARTYEVIEFNASSSTDEDGNITSYWWDFGNGFDATGMVVTREYTDDGIYNVTLEVTDDNFQSRQYKAKVKIKNRPPSLNLTHTPEDIFIGDTLTLDASHSSDRDGTIVGTQWTLPNGSVLTGNRIEYNVTTKRPIEIEIELRDDDGAMTTEIIEFKVGNLPPTCGNITYNELDEKIMKYEFVLGGINDTDSAIDFVVWRIDNGTEIRLSYLVENTFEFAFNTTGVHNITAWVIDEEGVESIGSHLLIYITREGALDVSNDDSGIKIPTGESDGNTGPSNGTWDQEKKEQEDAMPSYYVLITVIAVVLVLCIYYFYYRRRNYGIHYGSKKVLTGLVEPGSKEVYSSKEEERSLILGTSNQKGRESAVYENKRESGEIYAGKEHSPQATFVQTGRTRRSPVYLRKPQGNLSGKKSLSVDHGNNSAQKGSPPQISKLEKAVREAKQTLRQNDNDRE